MATQPNIKYIELKDYILKEDIGEGNFGKVKLGVSKITGEKFAIKIINKDQIKIKMKNKIFRENEVITKFNHINVIFVFEIIEDPENYYIVMEYCKRGELFDYIVDHERLTEDEAAIFFYQLINGVEYIHSKGIAHRDLKPENLLLTKDKTLKIIDFGLSHEFDGIDLLKTKCGSPSYASPEILRGKPYDGFKSDVWCCGIILYAMVCGYLPFDGDTNKILFKNILKCQPEVPDYLNDYTQDLIIRILTSDPDMRITIDEIKKHRFYLRGKKLCHIDYKMIEKNVLKKRKNKSSFRLNEDDNTYFITENLDDNEIIKKQIITREENMIKNIINEADREKIKEKLDKERDKINKNYFNNKRNISSNKEETNNNKSKILSNESNVESSIKNNSKGNYSSYLNNSKNDSNIKFQQNEQNSNNNKKEIHSFRDSIMNENNKKNIKKESFNHFNIALNNDMDAIFSSKRLNNNDNCKLNENNIFVLKNNNSINKKDQIKTPKNTNQNNFLDNSNKNKINEFLQNLGRNVNINAFSNDTRQKMFRFNLNNIDRNQKTIESKSPDKIIINKYTPTIAINDNNHNNLLNMNNNNNQIFAKIKNNINNNNKKHLFFNNFKTGRNINCKNISNEHSNNINNDISNERLININENNNINYNNNELNSNELNTNKKKNKSPDNISLNSFNQIKLVNCKSSNKNGQNLYYNNINININNYNIKHGNNNKKNNINFITNLNCANNETQKYKIHKKHSITNLHNSKKLYLNTDNNKELFKFNNKDNNEIFLKKIQKNNYITITDGNKDKLPSKTQENFYKPKKYYNFDKISFHSVNKDNKVVMNKKRSLKFKDNIFGNKNDMLRIKGGSEGKPFKHTHLDNFLQTISTNGFYKNRKSSKKIYFCGPINIKVSNNNYNVNNNSKNQFLPIMFKK